MTLVATRYRVLAKPGTTPVNKQQRMNYVRMFLEVGRVYDLSTRATGTHWFDNILFLDEKKFVLARGKDESYVWLLNTNAQNERDRYIDGAK